MTISLTNMQTGQTVTAATQVAMADLLGASQPNINAVLKGKRTSVAGHCLPSSFDADICDEAPRSTNTVYDCAAVAEDGTSEEEKATPNGFRKVFYNDTLLLCCTAERSLWSIVDDTPTRCKWAGDGHYHTAEGVLSYNQVMREGGFPRPCDAAYDCAAVADVEYMQ